MDTHRRFKENFQFFSGKSILDYGCGDGDFLKKTQDFAKSISGVELQIDYVNNLKNIGISCLMILIMLGKFY